MTNKYKILADPTISSKAKGLYLYLLGKPNKHIDKSEIKEGKKAIQSGIKELIDAGYLPKEFEGN